MLKRKVSLLAKPSLVVMLTMYYLCIRTLRERSLPTCRGKFSKGHYVTCGCLQEEVSVLLSGVLNTREGILFWLFHGIFIGGAFHGIPVQDAIQFFWQPAFLGLIVHSN